MKWLQDGDKNTKFFHNYVKGRRRKLHISNIEDDQGVMVSDEAGIGTTAIQVYEK